MKVYYSKILICLAVIFIVIEAAEMKPLVQKRSASSHVSSHQRALESALNHNKFAEFLVEHFKQQNIGEAKNQWPNSFEFRQADEDDNSNSRKRNNSKMNQLRKLTVFNG